MVPDYQGFLGCSVGKKSVAGEVMCLCISLCMSLITIVLNCKSHEKRKVMVDKDIELYSKSSLSNWKGIFFADGNRENNNASYCGHP